MATDREPTGAETEQPPGVRAKPQSVPSPLDDREATVETDHPVEPEPTNTNNEKPNINNRLPRYILQQNLYNTYSSNLFNKKYKRESVEEFRERLYNALDPPVRNRLILLAKKQRAGVCEQELVPDATYLFVPARIIAPPDVTDAELVFSVVLHLLSGVVNHSKYQIDTDNESVQKVFNQIKNFLTVLDKAVKTEVGISSQDKCT